MKRPIRVKICGITQPEQGQAIAHMGATALGFICVPTSPRYATPSQIQQTVACLASASLPHSVASIGVFANAALETIGQTVSETGLTGVQLHGHESPEFCDQVRQALPAVELIKAFRIRSAEDLALTQAFQDVVDSFLLDAYHPQLLGGTGHTLDWAMLQAFTPQRPWFLAGGLNPGNIRAALSQIQPDGIDLSSGVERSPGDKDLDQVAQLFNRLVLVPTSLG